MIKAFHKKMTVVYTITTGIILTLVLFVILAYSEKFMHLKNEESFQSSIWNLITTIQSDNIISHSWISQMESENQLIIHIEENEIPLLYKGSWEPETDRDTLINKIKALADKDNINLFDAPVSSDMQQSKIFHFKGDGNDYYQGIVIKVHCKSSYVNLIIIQSLQPIKKALFKQRCLFIFLDAAGIFALFIVSWLFVKKSLVPIKNNKEKQEEFFAAASHELRSPIAVIHASANAIRVNPKKAEHLVSNILSECSRLIRLTEDMLTLSQSNSPGWTANLNNINTDTLLLETYEKFQPICKEKGLALTLDLPDAPLAPIKGDYERLLQLLGILLDNAISHSLSEGRDKPIEISAKQLRRKIEIQVIDHGVGISNEQKKHIFDHFYKGDSSRGDKQHFGLGLGIAAELTKLHRGELSVTDTKKGGATFILTLPL